VDDERSKRPIIVLLLIALGLRLLWAMSQGAEPDNRLPDQSEYLQLGRNLLAGELKFFDRRFGQDVYAYRTPGYPLFIAACGGNVRAVRIAQALLDTSVVLAIYLIAREILAVRPSLFAAGVVAINPYLIYFSALILSETLFTAMLAWGMCLLVKRRRRALVGLVILALSTLVRPSALGLVVLLAGGAVWGRGMKTVSAHAALAALLVLACLFPWAYRNAHHSQLRSWIWTTTNAGITTYDGFNDAATGGSNQKPFLEQLKNLLAHTDEVYRDEYLSQQAHEWIRAHPDRVIELAFIKIARTWSPIPLSTEYGRKRMYVLAGLLYSVPFDLLLVIGLWKGVLPKAVKVFLLLPAIYFTGIHALSVGSLRYRIPCEPPMAVIVGSWAPAALRILHGPSRRKSG
jgi:4-amino-4-deoxy-L-arabinose transferase-like glycosyltransferase